MLGLIVLRMPVGLAMLIVGAAGYAHLAGPQPLIAFLKTTPYYTFANYTLSVIPLFVLMGALAERGGLARALFTAAAALVGHRRGGLASAVIAACAGFGAVCGSSVATTATFARAALPELLRYRCDPGFSTATVAVGGTLGILIPPSVVVVIYAISAEQNIAKLFMAALVPGLLAALFYVVTIAIVTRINPKLAPAIGRVDGTDPPQGVAAGVAGGADRPGGGWRHLWRHLHPDRGGGGRRIVDAGGGAGAGRPPLAGDPAGGDADRRDHRR